MDLSWNLGLMMIMSKENQDLKFISMKFNYLICNHKLTIKFVNNYLYMYYAKYMNNLFGNADFVGSGNETSGDTRVK